MTNTHCPSFDSHQQNAAETLGFAPGAILTAEQDAQVLALAEIEYRHCEGH